MPEDIRTIVRIPLSEIEDSIRSKHFLPKNMVEAHIEESSLVLTFADEQEISEVEEINAPPSPQDTVPRRRRFQRKRNRMRTRGWIVVARMTNSKGQKCAIYKPFVDALKNAHQLTSEEQKKVVERILKSNRNKPSDESIQYFLENTLEYLKTKPAGEPDNRSHLEAPES